MIERVDREVDLAAVALASGAPDFALLESGGPATSHSRFSVLALDPSEQLVARPGEPVLDRVAELHRSRARATRPQVPFASGLVGYLGYELLYEIEPSVPAPSGSDLGNPLAHLLVCETTVTVDRVERCTWISAGESAMDRILGLVNSAPDWSEPQSRVPVSLTTEGLVAAGVASDTPGPEYIDLVEDAKEHIRAGDVFELCITRRFDADARSADVHAALRAVTPAPMGAWLRLGEMEIACASPERLISLDAGGVAQTRPIKGTRPRSANRIEDEALRADLQTAEKDHAEHVMIVDVARNDLGRVCDAGSIVVKTLGEVEAHPTVWQMVSTVDGVLSGGNDAIDLLRAVFPAASMTGAPKVQAMKLIAEMERSQRGVYSGAIGYIDDGGAMDFNVVIRTLVCRGEHVTLHSGGAITSDSDAVDEEQETLDKAAALVRALQDATKA